MTTTRTWPPTPPTPPPGARRASAITPVDLSSGTSFADSVPHDSFDALRQSGGITWHDEPPPADFGVGNPMFRVEASPGFWSLTSHALVTEVDRDQEHFSSEAGGTFLTSMNDDSLGMLRQMMLNMDRPGHTRLRRILQPIFTPKSVAQLRSSVERNADDIIRDVDGDLELVAAVAAEMPLRVLADLLGMPRSDRHLIFDWSNALIAAQSPAASEDLDHALIAMSEMMAYGQEMAADRRAAPRDDVVSRIVNAEVDGERLSDTEFEMFWLLLIVAGNETTRNALSGSVLALHEHGLWTWLADRPKHLGTAVEELVRYVSPVQHFRRTAIDDVVLGDQQVRAGDKVVMWFGAANRDPAVFSEPHRLDLLRDPNPHVAFGLGPHFCLGAHLARLELTEMLRALLERVPQLDVRSVDRVSSNFINGIAQLQVTVNSTRGTS